MAREELIRSSNLLMAAHSKGKAPNIYNSGPFGLDSTVPETEDGAMLPSEIPNSKLKDLEISGCSRSPVPEKCSAQLDSELVGLSHPAPEPFPVWGAGVLFCTEKKANTRCALRVLTLGNLSEQKLMNQRESSENQSSTASLFTHGQH